MKIYLAADHGGFALKQELIDFVRELGHEPMDCGAYTLDENDDYPDIIANAARKLCHDVEHGVESRAIVVGASGQGEAIVANRFRGVRCALYYGPAARPQQDMSGKTLDLLTSTRVHNDANALSLGARFLASEEAKDVVKIWLSTAFPAEVRHARRVAQIDEVS